MKEKECLHCGTSFKPKTHNQKFCKTDCRKAHNKGEAPPAKIVELVAPKISETPSEETPKIVDIPPLNDGENSESNSDAVNAEISENDEQLETPKNEGLNDDSTSKIIDENSTTVNSESETLETTKIQGLESEISDSLKIAVVDDENGEQPNEESEAESSDLNSEENSEIEHFDLSDHLANNETVEKDFSTSVETPPPSENDDFDQEQVQAIEEEIEQEQETALQVKEDLLNDSVKVLMNPKEAASISISAFSVLQDFLLPFLYKKTAFTKPQESRLKSLARLSKEKKLNNLSEEDYELLDEWSAYEDYKELVPLTKKEKELLQTPLEKVFQSSDGKGMSPLWALILVLITILSSRMIPIATAFKNRNKFDNETKHLRTNHRKEGLRKE